ncbi:MAG TPA: endonuclease [Gemmatimonadaceae bacterium]
MSLLSISSVRRAAALALAAAVLGCSSDNPTAPQFADLTGTFDGTVEEGGTTTVSVVPGRSGPTHVVVCAPVGEVIETQVDAVVGSPTDVSYCSRLEFEARAGATYDIAVRSVEGSGGPFTGCWATSLVECSPLVEIPRPATCTVRPFSADTTLPAGYYDRVRDWTGQRLLLELHYITCSQRILADPESPFPDDEAYEHSRDSLYDFVDDPDGDDTIVDIYTGRAETVTTRAEAAAVDFNTEHSWPQSMGADELPAYSDLHHLFTADETANGQRLNHPFGVVVDTVWESTPVAAPGGGTESSVRGLDADGRTVFEPRDSKKGDIARALLYFYVRYAMAEDFDVDLSNFEIEEATLLQWHEQDPPDAFEQQRNALVFRAQGNRNPFIDRPELVEAVGDFPN